MHAYARTVSLLNMHYTLKGPLKLDGGEETKIFDLVLKMKGAQSGATQSHFW